MEEARSDPQQREGGSELPPPSRAISLAEREEGIKLIRPSLKEMIAEEILKLFSRSLLFTLCFAALLVILDAIFLLMKVVTPDQRLMSKEVVMTFVGATVVQVGAALAAIVVSVFKDQPVHSDDRNKGSNGEG